MESFCINVKEAKVRYISEFPLISYFLKNKEFMEFYDAKIISDSQDVKYTIEYHDCLGENPIIVSDNKMIISYPKEELTESIILYLGFHFLEKQFGELGMCSCHSACIEKDGEATLLIGEAGAGKTSIAVNLCCQKGYRLISNDMTLIGNSDGQLMAYGGTKFLNLRLLSVKQNMPFLSYLFKNDKMDLWTNKISIMARDISIEEQYDSIPIKNVLFIHVDEREELKQSNGDSWRNNFLLYQNISNHIRGVAATFIDKKGHPIGYIPSFDSLQTYLKRKQIIDLINQNPNYYYVSGNLGDVLAFIENLNIEKKYVKTIGGNHE